MSDLAGELRAHLRRLAFWSVASLLAGLAMLALRGTDPILASFAVWTAGWAAVNLVICAFSARGKPPEDRGRFREFLLFNQGLNVGYVGVGLTLILAATSPEVRAAGLAVAVQGLGLAVLDAILIRRTRA